MQPSKRSQANTRCRYEYDYNDLITVLVGEDEEKFSVHKDSICEKSKFLSAAVSSGRWREGKKKLVRLPDIRSDKFRLYVHWVYTGEVVPEVKWNVPEADADQALSAYIAAYILGDVLDDHRLGECAIETMIDKCPGKSGVPGGEWCTAIWEQTSVSSPLRIFLVRFTWDYMTTEQFATLLPTYPREFLEQSALWAMCTNHDRPSDSVFQECVRNALFPIE